MPSVASTPAKRLVARNSSEARRTEAEARLVFGDSGDALARATLLSAESVRFARTVDGQISLTRYLGLLPKPPLWRQSVGPTGFVTNGQRQRALAVSPDGGVIYVSISDFNPQFETPEDKIVAIDVRSNEVVGEFRAGGNPERLAVNPDGTQIWASLEARTVEELADLVPAGAGRRSSA